MPRLLVRRLAIMLVAVVAVNFIAFAYAHIALRVHFRTNPYGSSYEGFPPVLRLYRLYVDQLLQGEFGQIHVGVGQPVGQVVLEAAGASLGLLAVAFGLSLVVGLVLGMAAVRVEPARVQRWLVPVTTTGLAMPSFYVGTLFISGLVFYVVRGGEGTTPPLPLQGFGWDAHLVLPTLALMVRPTVQIAQVTAGLLAGELGQQYVVAARSRGNSWLRARWKHALRNVMAPVILAIAGSLRLLIGELIIIEWLFGWPGLGRLLALTLIAPRVAGPGGFDGGHDLYFLHPQLMAALLPIFTVLFLLADTVASSLAHLIDPAQQASEVEVAHA